LAIGRAVKQILKKRRNKWGIAAASGSQFGGFGIGGDYPAER
jgi:hypothetical protein